MMRIETELFISHPPEKVWEVLMDFEKFPQWNPMIVKISGNKEMGGKLDVQINDPSGSGKHLNFKPQIIAYTPEKYFAWRGRLLIPNIFDGVHYFRLTPAGNGTLFHHGEAFSGVLVKLFGKKFFKDYPKGFGDMNIALAKYLG